MDFKVSRNIPPSLGQKQSNTRFTQRLLQLFSEAEVYHAINRLAYQRQWHTAKFLLNCGAEPQLLSYSIRCAVALHDLIDQFRFTGRLRDRLAFAFFNLPY